jgi:hypothetical protein
MTQLDFRKLVNHARHIYAHTANDTYVPVTRKGALEWGSLKGSSRIVGKSEGWEKLPILWIACRHSGEEITD